MLGEDLLQLVFRTYVMKIDLFMEVFPGDFFEKFVQSVISTRVQRGKPLSSEQAKVVIRIAERMRGRAEQFDTTEYEIDQLISRPRFRHDPYASRVVKREVRYLGDNVLGFRFKRTDELYELFKSLIRNDENNGSFVDYTNAVWVIPVTRGNLQKMIGIISDYGFDFDQTIAEYLTLCSNSKDQPSYVVFDEEDDKVVINVCDNPMFADWIKNVLGEEQA